MSTSGTVRVSAGTHRMLAQLAERSGMSMSKTLEQAVETLRRQTLLEETNRAYAALRSDQKRWKEEQAERAAWEATLPDGLEDD
jgi:predicted transcriptional regulator